MKLTITHLKLKSPLHFFKLSSSAMSILKQLKSTNHKGFKKSGFWLDHYTMTLWENEEELKDFAKSGAHLKAMKDSAKIASEISTITLDSTSLLDWKAAKEHLKSAKPIRF